MQSKRNKYLALSLTLLVLVSASLFIASREEARPVIDPEYFAIPDTEHIDRVQLLSPSDTVDLSFDGSRWKVNGNWDADAQMIKVLMAALRQVEPHRPVAMTMRESVVGRLKENGTQVTLTMAGRETVKFLAGGNSRQSESWFLKDGDDQPMIMIIPGYRVYVSGIFQMKKGDWRNKRIFEFNWRNFKSLSATYPTESNQNFTVELRGQELSMVGLPKVDTTKLTDYVDAVSLLQAKRFVDAGKGAGSPQVLVSIEIKDIGNRAYLLELFKPGDGDREIYGRMTGGQVVAFDRESIPSVIRRRTYFVPKDTR